MGVNRIDLADLGRSSLHPYKIGDECLEMGEASFKPRDVVSDRGYRVAMPKLWLRRAMRVTLDWESGGIRRK